MSEQRPREFSLKRKKNSTIESDYDALEIIADKAYSRLAGVLGCIHVVEFSAFEAMRARAEAAERLAQFASGDGWNELPKLREKIASLEEILSYLPKVPTQPYEKEMAKQILKLEAERDEWKSKYEASEWVRKDTALRTYDGLTVEIDQLRRDNEGLVEALECINDEVGDSQGRDVPIIRKIAREAIEKFGGMK